MTLRLSVQNFLAIREADLVSQRPIVVLVGPNRTGKTQLLLLLYTFLWCAWKKQVDGECPFKSKLERVFLAKAKDLVRWGANRATVTLDVAKTQVFTLSIERSGRMDLDISPGLETVTQSWLPRPPVYIQPSGLGDYYKGIFSLKKYFQGWRLVSEAVTDLLYDLMILQGENRLGNDALSREFEKLFQASFYIQNQRIYVQEKGKRYKIERSASGLKSLSFLYLALRYGILGKILLLDEPEANLHPLFIRNLVRFISVLAQTRKIFVATHSDYFLESLNQWIAESEATVDVWEAKLEPDGSVVYRCYEASPEQWIDVTPLTDIYLDLLRKGRHA